MKMPNWVRKQRQRRRYIIPGLIWFAAVALFVAVWICVILQTDG
jgi:predicted nucleic acid-binding Zn ribbon protein